MTAIARLANLTLAAWCAVASAPAHAADDLRRTFPQEAPVLVAPPGGLARLVLPAAVRAACQPDLSDLRLLDRHGREVPFLVDVARASSGPAPQTMDAVIVDVFREEQRREDAPPLRRESFVLETPEGFDPALRWSVVLDPGAARDFVRRVEVTQARAPGETAHLSEGRSVFRLAGADARTRVDVPGLRAGRFTVTLAGEGEAYLSPAFRLERTTEIVQPARIAVPLAERRRATEGGRTTLVLDRPSGIVPERVRLQTASPIFARPVRVTDVLPTGRRVQLGEGLLRRTSAGDAEAKLEVDVSAARGAQLEVEIVDLDSPPLDAVAVEAVLREESLVFSLPGSDGPAGTLLFGGGRVRPPRYDVARLAELTDGEASPARLGDAVRNPAFDDRPLLGFAMRPGAALDPRVFAYRRALAIPPSPAGLARVRLDPSDLAAARPDLADVRIVDGEGRQWPYLLERDAVIATLPLEMRQAGREGRQARYTLVPSPRPLRLLGIEMDVDAGFVDRPFTLAGTDAQGAERMLAGGRLQRAAGSNAPLRISFTDLRASELELVTQNGDETPLAIIAVRAWSPLPELYLAAPAGDYALLAGDPGADAPQYDIAAVRSRVLAVPAVDATTEPGGPNPAFSSGAATARRIAGGRLLPQLAVWTVLVLAVLVLTVLTLRVVRRDATP